jgi:hypothetical protein
MFDSPFDFFALLIAVVAFIFARKAFNQADMLRARLDAIEATGLQARPGPPPLTAFEGLEQPPQQHRQALPPNRRKRSPVLNRSRLPQATRTRPRRTATALRQRRRRRSRNPSPASRSASAPAGWSGSAD